MAIWQFLNSIEKQIDNKSGEILERIIKAYSIGDRYYQTDDKDVVIFRVNYSEVFQALQTFWFFKEQHKKRYSELIAKMNGHEQLMQACSCQEQKQTSIKAFLD